MRMLIVALLLWASVTEAATVTLTVVGNPTTGPWGVEGKVADTRDVMADTYLDGTFHHTEHTAPYGFPDDNGTTATTAKFGNGPHTVLFVFKLEGTSTEIGRASVTVMEGAPQTPPGQVLGLAFTLTTIADPVRLIWDANTESDLAGYRVYVRFPGGIYAMAGTVTQPTGTVNGLEVGKTYEFVVTAFDRSNNESGYSNRVSTVAQ